MAIAEIRNNYPETHKVSVSTGKKNEKTDDSYSNSKEYANYLDDKYNCLQPSKDDSVTIAPDLLSKAAGDPKTSRWLEGNLKLIPAVLDSIYQNAAKNGSKVLSCSISFDAHDSMTTQVHSVSVAESGREEVEKNAEEIRTKNKERKKQLQEQRLATDSAITLLSKVSDMDFSLKDQEDGLFIDFKI